MLFGSSISSVMISWCCVSYVTVNGTSSAFGLLVWQKKNGITTVLRNIHILKTCFMDYLEDELIMKIVIRWNPNYMWKLVWAPACRMRLSGWGWCIDVCSQFLSGVIYIHPYCKIWRFRLFNQIQYWLWIFSNPLSNLIRNTFTEWQITEGYNSYNSNMSNQLLLAQNQ